MFHQGAGGDIKTAHINQYVEQVAQAPGCVPPEATRSCASISVFISVFAVLALIITGCACWYIYRNLGPT